MSRLQIPRSHPPCTCKSSMQSAPIHTLSLTETILSCPNYLAISFILQNNVARFVISWCNVGNESYTQCFKIHVSLNSKGTTQVKITLNSVPIIHYCMMHNWNVTSLSKSADYAFFNAVSLKTLCRWKKIWYKAISKPMERSRAIR